MEQGLELDVEGLPFIDRQATGADSKLPGDWEPAALDASDVPMVLYTEPDKQPFFEKQLLPFLEKCGKQRRADLCFASRDKKSFQTFPEGQQRTERFLNESAGLLLVKETDYCYGPILLSRAAAGLALDAPDHLGWGWRFWLAGNR